MYQINPTYLWLKQEGEGFLSYKMSRKCNQEKQDNSIVLRDSGSFVPCCSAILNTQLLFISKMVTLVPAIIVIFQPERTVTVEVWVERGKGGYTFAHEECDL